MVPNKRTYSELLGTLCVLLSGIFDAARNGSKLIRKRCKTVPRGHGPWHTDMLLMPTGAIFGLNDARMANIVGIPLMAITSDRQVLFVLQSGRNSVLPNGFAASSSGSLDWADAKRAQHRAVKLDRPVLLREALFEGMLRELLEESQVSRHEIVEGSEYVTGYFRWLSRGAKPEFTGIVRLTVTLAELEGRKVKGAEKNYTAGRFSVPVSLLQESAATWEQDQEKLYEELHNQLPKSQREQLTWRVPIGVSSIAAWCAAADFVASHPGYLAEVSAFKDAE